MLRTADGKQVTMLRWYRKNSEWIMVLLFLYEVTIAAFTGEVTYWVTAGFMLASWYINYVPNNIFDRWGYKIFDAYMTKKEARHGHR